MHSKITTLSLFGALCLSSLLSTLPVVTAAAAPKTCDALNCVALLRGKKTIENFEDVSKECVEKISATAAASYNVHDYMEDTDIRGHYSSVYLVDLKGLRQSSFGTVVPYKGVTCSVDCSRKCPNIREFMLWHFTARQAK